MIDISKPIELLDGTKLVGAKLTGTSNDGRFVAYIDGRESRVFNADGTSRYGTGDCRNSVPAFDPSKPVQTRLGSKARIIATDCQGPFPIAAEVQRPGRCGWGVATFTASGGVGLRGECSADLVNVPVETVEYINVYPGKSYAPFCKHATAALAKASFSRSTDGFTIEVTRTDGKVTNVELCPAA